MSEISSEKEFSEDNMQHFEVFAWQIPNVSSIPHEVNYLVLSPPFIFDSTPWILKMYPNGQTRHRSNGYIDLTIQRLQCQPEKQKIFIQMFCKDIFNEKVNPVSRILDFSSQCLPINVVEFMQNLKDCPEKWRLAPNDSLTLVIAFRKEMIREKEQDSKTKSDEQTVDPNSKYVGAVVGAASGAAAIVGGATAAIPAIGFTSSGVAAGSIAAGIHSTIGNVAAGSLFASCQSAGVLGLATGTKVALGTVGAVAGGALAVVAAPAIGVGIYKIRKSETAKTAATSFKRCTVRLATSTKERLKGSRAGATSKNSTSSVAASRTSSSISELTADTKEVSGTADTATVGTVERVTAPPTAGKIVELTSDAKVPLKSAKIASISGEAAGSSARSATSGFSRLASSTMRALKWLKR